MATVTITQDNVEEILKGKDGKDIVLLDWWAEWCGPCQMFGPIYEEASERHQDIVFGKIDTEDQQMLAGSIGITSIPTLMVFKEGVMVFRQAGAVPGSALDDLIEQARNLDMDAVRKQIEEQVEQASAGQDESEEESA